MPWRVSKNDPTGRLQEWVDEPVMAAGGRAAMEPRARTTLTKTPQFWNGERWVIRDSEWPFVMDGSLDPFEYSTDGPLHGELRLRLTEIKARVGRGVANPAAAPTCRECALQCCPRRGG